MEYQYIPDSYQEDLVQSKFENQDSFVKFQVLYRTGLEAQLKKMIDVPKLNDLIQKSGVVIPSVKDTETNFYHKYSTLGSAYLFLRNNFHVERLSASELQALETTSLDWDFYQKTLDRVVFEEGDIAFFGIPNDETRVLAKSIVFEFAYDQKQCMDLAQLKEIHRVIESVFVAVEKRMSQTGLPTSFLIYQANPSLFPQESDVTLA